MITNLLEVSKLQQLFKTLSFSISTEPSRYYLNGVCLEKVGDEVSWVSTDGHKLTHINAYDNMYCEFTEDSFAGKDFSYIIPHSAILELLKLPKGNYKYIQLEVHEAEKSSDCKISFIFDKTTSIRTYKLIDGTYPDWRKVVAGKFDSKVAFNSKYLKELCMLNGDNRIELHANKLKKMQPNGKLKEVNEVDNRAPFFAKNSKGANFYIMPMVL